MSEAINRQGDERNQPSPEEMLARTAGDFSRSVHETASHFSESMQTFVSEMIEAWRLYTEQQLGLVRRQEELRDETSRFADLARSYGQQAVSAANETASSQQRATELVGVLEQERQALNLLIEDLRGRISALTVLVAPLPVLGSGQQQVQPALEPEPSPQPEQTEAAGRVEHSSRRMAWDPASISRGFALACGPGWTRPTTSPAWAPGWES